MIILVVPGPNGPDVGYPRAYDGGGNPYVIPVGMFLQARLDSFK